MVSQQEIKSTPAQQAAIESLAVSQMAHDQLMSLTPSLGLGTLLCVVFQSLKR